RVDMLGMLDLGMIILKWLAVVGGFAVGAFTVGLLLQLFARLVAVRQGPRPALALTRLLRGFGLWLAVYFGGFGAGGSGLGGSGSGFWPFGQKGGGGGAKDGPSTKPVPSSPDKPAKGETLVIQMRGGKEAEQSQRFYVVDDQPAVSL